MEMNLFKPNDGYDLTMMTICVFNVTLSKPVLDSFMALFTIDFLDILCRKQPASSMRKDRGTVIVYLVFNLSVS